MPPPVGYFSPFVPPEWIAAHGLKPRRLTPSADRTQGLPLPVTGVCPLARTVANTAASSSLAAVILTTHCDQIRRAADALQTDGSTPVFLMNLPATWTTQTAQHLYRSELERLGRFLVTLGGSPPCPERLRQTLQQYATPKNAPSPAARNTNSQPPTLPRVPVGIVGEELWDPASLFSRIEALGGRVVLDGTLSGERGRSAPLEPQLFETDPLAALTQARLLGIPDVFQRPDTRFHDWLADRLQLRGARGLIVWHYPWCDLWRAQIPSLKESLRQPVLDLEAQESPGITPRMETRLQAFLESLAHHR